ncbi:MAG: AsmA family protein [Gammaproteobacteria bacterium]|nr:AsmA family protein [Gammaproteobacteria bacterium]NNL51300.1 AsmA family protein [Woeseiaceae bacterium]
MGRLTKILALLLAAFVAIFALAAVAFFLFFDANDFRDEVATAVKDRTGRDLVIEGDVSLTFFPWLAIDVGHTTLGNAPGFGDKPFAEFDRAKLSVRLLPLLLRQEIGINAAELEALKLSLEVNRGGIGNWEDLFSRDDAAKEKDDSGEGRAIAVAGVDVDNATISYDDRKSGDSYRLREVRLRLGRISDEGQPVPASGSFLFEVQPGDISGNLDVETVLSFDLGKSLVTFDGFSAAGVVEGIANSPTRLQVETDGIEIKTDEQRATVQPLAMTVLGIDIKADVEPFSYAGAIEPVAVIKTDAFSPRSVMTLLDIEAPETADPVALSRVIIDAKAAFKENAVDMTGVTIKLDDTTFKGTLAVPRQSTGSYRFNLDADQIDLNRYMEPVEAGARGGAGASTPVEIPSDLIRPLNARGNLRVSTALLGGMTFENVVLGLNTANGRMRIHPVTAGLFGGSYSGDVNIDVAGKTPVIAVDEKVQNVNLADLAQGMFGKKNITGTISGGFKLTGRGNDMAAVQRSLGGNMSFQLNDGTYEGTDIWYELRRARALLKGGEAPTPQLPARTRFSSVRATGVVTNGVMRNDDLMAELPFMQMSGRGDVDLAAATVNYSLTARVLERPESLQNMTEAELKDFTRAVIPLKITGPITSPSVKPDVQALLRKRVEDEIKERVVDRLLGGGKKTPTPEEGAAVPAEGETPAEGEAPPAAETEKPPEEKDVEDELKDKLKDLLRR